MPRKKPENVMIAFDDLDALSDHSNDLQPGDSSYIQNSNHDKKSTFSIATVREHSCASASIWKGHSMS